MIGKSTVQAASYAYVQNEEYEGVHAVYIGYKKTQGVNTRRHCLVFAVERKVSHAEMVERGIPFLPSQLDEYETDVVECPRMKAQGNWKQMRGPVPPVEPEGMLIPQGVRDRNRPAPGGVSVGHEEITAGTLGGWVHTVANSGFWYALTNAHVGADTNEGLAGDPVLQPGPFDGGGPNDFLGPLYQRASIRMGGIGDSVPGPGCPNVEPPPPAPKKSKPASVYWKVGTALLNAGPRLFGCPYRATVMSEVKARFRLQGAFIQRWMRAQESGPFCLDQPWPNLIDACLVGPVDSVHVEPEIFGIGRPTAVGDPPLGTPVQKQGRTTFRTKGMVVGVNGSVQVSYGNDGTALFEDQIFIEGIGGDFSAGGDSGSWVVSELGTVFYGLLFAGGGGTTIANRATVVMSTLGATL